MAVESIHQVARAAVCSVRGCFEKDQFMGGIVTGEVFLSYGCVEKKATFIAAGILDKQIVSRR